MMKYINKIIIALFALGTIFVSCDSLIYDDLEDCPQGVYVKFFSMTPCETDSSFIGKVSSLTLFAFDKNDKLVIAIDKKDVNLTRDYDILVPVSNGEFTFIAWAGLDDNFNIGTFTPGITTKKDVMMTLKTVADKAAKINGTKVWQGQNNKPVFLPDPSVWATVYEYTAVNLTEITNRVTLIIDFDETFTPVITNNFDVSIRSNNGSMLIDGTVPDNNPVITYNAWAKSDSKNIMTWNFTMLDLVKGLTNDLVITYLDTGEEFFNKNIIDHIILNTINGDINIDCENDFEIRMNLTDYCLTCESHYSVVVYVNGYKVHSYEIAPGNEY